MRGACGECRLGVVRCASRGYRFRADGQPVAIARRAAWLQRRETMHVTAQRPTSAVALACASSAHPRGRMPQKSTASATRHSLLPPGEGAPKGRMRGRPPASLISPLPHAVRQATRSAISRSAEPMPHSLHTAERCNRPPTSRTGFVAPFPSRPSVAKAHTQGCATFPGYFLQTAVIDASSAKTASIIFSIATQKMVMNHHDWCE
ncbi:hypothetical protein CKU38_04316 [Xanthomonas citri pv. fuscans]|nr:hypothetical protein CKU38_04316 [Xanthomonas citri pv. fuscans]